VVHREGCRGSGGAINDPRRTARLAGALWLVVIAAGVVSVVTRSRIPELAFATNQFSAVCYLGVTVLLYRLFNPVEANLSLFAAFCGLAGVASGERFLVAMVFFGAQIFSVGYLITRSTLVPWLLGLLLMLGGASYMINSFANFLAPAMGARFAPFIIPVAILGEGALTLWFLVKGVNVQTLPVDS
jgi:hypothetical protein